MRYVGTFQNGTNHREGDERRGLSMSDNRHGGDQERSAVLAWACLYGIGIACVFLAAQQWIGNVHIATTNGLWKSLYLGKWVKDPAWSLLDASNALFYPVYAFLCTVLDLLGVFPGMLWRQMAVLNALFAGLAGGVAFAFVARWTGRYSVALLATTAYILSGYPLLLGLINEDIMPSFSIVLTATLLACAWFTRPTALCIAVVAAVFAIGWLFEWRLMFPSLPPFLLALFLARGTLIQRILRPAWFLVVMTLPPTLLAASAWLTGGRSFAGASKLVTTLFWTGKGVGTGWGGFSLAKVWLLWAGMSEDLFGGRHILTPEWPRGDHAAEVLAGTFLGLLLAAVTLTYVWQHRKDPAVRTAFVVVGGNFACGVVFNLYSQPQDPQMQINVMIWVLFGWVLLISWLLGRPAASPTRTDFTRPAMVVLAAILVAMPIGYGFAVAYEHRGLDNRMMSLVSRIESNFDPSRTVFAFHDFDGTITWMAALWDNPSGRFELSTPAPTAVPKFKYIGLVRGVVEQSKWTGEQVADNLVSQIDKALMLGYRVVTPEFWTTSEQSWITSFSTVSDAQKPVSIRARLHREFKARQVWNDPVSGPWFEISRE